MRWFPVLHWGQQGVQSQCGRYLVLPATDNPLWWSARYWCTRTFRTYELTPSWSVAEARAVAREHLLTWCGAGTSTPSAAEALESVARAR